MIPDGWRTAESMPVGVAVRVLTSTGLERSARRKEFSSVIDTYYRPRGCRRIACKGVWVIADGSDLTVIGWRIGQS
jgi:hypothetical protein